MMNEREIYVAAMAKNTPAERAAFLDGACGSDSQLRARIEVLLAEQDRLGSFLESPPALLREGEELTRGPTSLDSIEPQIGPYKILQRIGEGGMGSVYMAEQHEPVKRRVALKVIKAGLDSQQVMARFEAERQALALMDHPNIAKVLDAGSTASGRPYFVMELVKGVPLAKYCDERQLTLTQRLQLFQLICQAVQHAHHKGIIHRDLKPSNILVAEYDQQPVPKIIDFGVAKAIHQQLTDETLFTHYGQIVGTLEYMSPEQATLNQLDVDTRSDVYSLGVILYELLTGQGPIDRQRFRHAAFDEVLRIIREEEPPRPSTRLSGSGSLPSVAALRQVDPRRLSGLLRGELDWIVMKALEKDRHRRYDSAQALFNDISHFLHDEPVEACPPALGYKFRKFARRHRAIVVTSGLVATSLLGGLAATSWQAVRATKAEQLAKDNEQQAQANATVAIRERDAAELARREETRQRQIAEGRHQAAQAAASEAQQQMQIAEAINDFLQTDLLKQADVREQAVDAWSRDPNLRVRTLLDRASQRIATGFPGQPQVEAAIRETIGTTYYALGLFAEAQPHLDRALELYRVTLGSDHLKTLRCTTELGALDEAQGRLPQAVARYEATLARLRQRLGEDHPQTLSTKHNLGAALLAAGRWSEAESLIDEVLQARTKSLGREHRKTIATRANLAAIYAAQSKYDQAEQVLLELLEIQTRLAGKEHPETQTVASNLARVYQDQERFAEAEPLLVEAIANLRKLLGDDHLATLTALDNLAQLQLSMGRHAEARRAHEEVLRLKEVKLGMDHPSTLISRHNLARVYVAQRDLAKAIPLYETTWKTQQELLGVEHSHTLTTAVNLGHAWFLSGRREEGLAAVEQAVALRQKTLGPNHADTVSAQVMLVALYQESRRYGEAVRLLEQAVERRRETLGANHPGTLTLLNRLGTVYWQARRLDQSIPTFEKCLQLRTEVLGPDHLETLQTAANLGVNYKDAGRLADAIPLLKRTQSTTAQWPQLEWVSRQLADAYEKSGHFAEAEPLLAAEARKIEQASGADHRDYQQALVDLSVNRLRQRKFKEAAEVFHEAVAVATKHRPQHPETCLLMIQLGATQLAAENYAEAETWLLRGHDGLKTLDQPVPSEVYQLLVRVYEKLGNVEKAKIWQDLLEQAPPSKPAQPQPR